MKKLIMFSLMAFSTMLLTSAVSASPPITPKVELLKVLPAPAACINPMVITFDNVEVFTLPEATVVTITQVPITNRIPDLTTNHIELGSMNRPPNQLQLSKLITYGMRTSGFRYHKSDQNRSFNFTKNIIAQNGRC
jgi:hypothetical protein